MPATYEPIATTTLGSTASTITFSSISSAYTDLRVVLVTTSGSGTPALRFNNISTTTYSWTYLKGNGTAAASGTSSNDVYIGLGVSAAPPLMFTIDVFSYAGSTNKTALVSTAADNNGSGEVMRAVGLWRSTAAITRIDLIQQGATTYGAGTTATLYGIL